MISFFEDERIFKLDTSGTSYIISIVDDEGFVGHTYYGKRLNSAKTDDLTRIYEPPYVPSKNNRDRGAFLDSFPMEYSIFGTGDFRESCIAARDSAGFTGSAVKYTGYRTYKGKKPINGLPATFGTADDCDTLEIICEDPGLGLRITLFYTAFERLDVIARRVEIKNVGGGPVFLDRVLSCCIDMDNNDFDMITLHGSWARERAITRVPIANGKRGVFSPRGESSHQEQPFFALANKNATRESGEVYAFHFVYSGNFFAQAEVTQFNAVRAVMGVNPLNFSWKLEPQDEFFAPEVILTYSDEGLGKMTRTLHDLYRGHLIRGFEKKRPVLINNWEATYFSFDTDKLLSIAREARKLGVELFVLDDGWFGKRDDDNSSLGDWIVNEEKLKGGLKRLAEEINKLGMRFGLWLEPEMVSPDSDLYRLHPDWALTGPAGGGTLIRNQYVLD
ncbi:MAG: alpha-galactosidase, partial [Clostridiales bacterium]|nr:alpha-galactosidase [Clostridiales bacterium]